jgi:predicted nucleic acid-binding protein
MRFVDTNVLLYAISTDQRELGKHQRAREVLSDKDLALSIQVLQEFYAQATRPTRVDRLTPEQAARFARSMERYPIQENTLAVFRSALDIQSRFSLSFWDASIVAAAKQIGCSELLSEDMAAAADYDGVRVVNPFANQ